MKTAIINLDDLTPEVFKELMGFVLTIGLNFRKLDQKKESGTGRCLFVELETKAEEKALKEFLTKNEIPLPITILPNNKAVIGLKSIGKLKLLGENAKSNAYYLDKTTNKRLVIV